MTGNSNINRKKKKGNLKAMLEIGGFHVLINLNLVHVKREFNSSNYNITNNQLYDYYL
jgi:hypothetical protein